MALDKFFNTWTVRKKMKVFYYGASAAGASAAGASSAGAGAGALHGPKTKEIVNGTSMTTRGKARVGSIN